MASKTERIKKYKILLTKLRRTPQSIQPAEAEIKPEDAQKLS